MTTPTSAPLKTVGKIPQPGKLPTIPPAQAVTAEDPSWWRLGSVPFLVLLLVAAAADLAWPRDGGFGIGAGIGCFIAINALLLLRRDFSRGEYWFLQGLACLNMLMLTIFGSMVNWFTSLVIPFLLVLLPTCKNCIPTKESPTEPQKRYRNWWSFWFANRPTDKEKKGKFSALRTLLPLFICILIGIISFVAFLCIFASGNPVVELVWDTIVTWWNKLVELFHISWDFWVHVFYWFVGFLWFGIYCFSRPKAHTAATSEPAPAPSGTTLLPYLPLCLLIGINAAFLVATSTDIAYLWFGNVPEGISQTTYLHDGAASITWASVLAAGILLLLFRRKGIARRSVASRFFGYLLVIQTALLAVSVYMRLYYQIEDYGFTVRRIQAAEAMMLGLEGLIILVIYMATNGAFWKYTKICLGTVILMVITFISYSPAHLAGHLNMRYISSHPHWNFSLSDFNIGRFNVHENLNFAYYVYQHTTPSEVYSTEHFKQSLHQAAESVERKATEGSWLTFNLSMLEDVHAAEQILGRPITIKLVQKED